MIEIAQQLRYEISYLSDQMQKTYSIKELAITATKILKLAYIETDYIEINQDNHLLGCNSKDNLRMSLFVCFI